MGGLNLAALKKRHAFACCAGKPRSSSTFAGNRMRRDIVLLVDIGSDTDAGLD